jgi:uncharacterized protein YuzE
MASVKLTYDVDADAAFIYLVDSIEAGQVAESQMCDLEIREGAVILALDANGHLLGIEILGASRLLSAEVLATARTSGPKA